MSKKKTYSDEELKVRKNERQKEKRKNESKEEKLKRYEAQKKWNEKNPNKIKEYRIKHENKDKAAKRSRKWYEENREKHYEHNANYRRRNPERYRAILNESYRRNREEFLKRRRKRVAEKKINDPSWKMSENIRSLISLSFKDQDFKKSKKTEDILGCKIVDFIQYILNMYPEKNLTINQFSKFGYHLDHIIPISLAKTQEDILKLNHYTNFQPLWWRDNLIKSNKLIAV